MTPDELSAHLADLGRVPVDIDLDGLETRLRAAIRRVVNDPVEAHRVRELNRSFRAGVAADTVFGDDSAVELVAEDFVDLDGEDAEDEGDYDEIAELRAEAARQGADYALHLADETQLTDAEAKSIAEETSRPSALDDWAWPDWRTDDAQIPTPASIAPHLGWDSAQMDDDWMAAVADELAGTWEATAKDVYRAALEAVALRTLGRLEDALDIERRLQVRTR